MKWEELNLGDGYIWRRLFHDGKPLYDVRMDFYHRHYVYIPPMGCYLTPHLNVVYDWDDTQPLFPSLEAAKEACERHYDLLVLV